MRRPPRHVPLVLASTVLLAVATIGCASSSSSGSTTEPSKDTFCALLAAFRVSNDALSTDVGSADPATMRTAITRLVGQAETLQERAPADIVADVTTATTFLTQLQSLFAKFSYDLTALQADPAAVEEFAAINSGEVQASLDQLRAYGDTDCTT